MPVKYTISFTRPNDKVRFYAATDDWNAYQKSAYEETGLRLSWEVKPYSEGDAVRTHVAVWKDQEALDTFNNDPWAQYKYFTPRAEYCAQHGIVISTATVETI